MPFLDTTAPYAGAEGIEPSLSGAVATGAVPSMSPEAYRARFRERRTSAEPGSAVPVPVGRAGDA